MPTACLLRAYVAYGLTACSIELSVELIVEMRARQLYIISHARACCLRACVPRGLPVCLGVVKTLRRRGTGVAQAWLVKSTKSIRARKRGCIEIKISALESQDQGLQKYWSNFL